MVFALVPSPIGVLCATRSMDAASGLSGLFTEMQTDDLCQTPEWREDASGFLDVRRELDAYFAGKRKTFSIGLAVDERGTPFQRAVWRALQAIPCGETKTYADVAASVGRPKAVRAVGAAVGMNPWTILVPCHRVVGTDGALTGFAGGLGRKRWLLEHEGVRVERGKGEADPKARIVARSAQAALFAGA
jgi:methylated-DNA-[protein]-cysteine S-methyltransferase